MKKRMITILMFAIVLICFGACSDNQADVSITKESTIIAESEEGEAGKWLVTNIKEVDENGEVKNEEWFEYDAYGRLCGYKENDYQSYAFCYDSEGRVISKKHETFNNTTQKIVGDDYYYEYDEKGNCVKEVFSGEVGVGFFFEYVFYYTYDENSNLIKETKEVKKEANFTTVLRSYEILKDITYKNGKCVEAKVKSRYSNEDSIELVADDGFSYSESIERYNYDENGNLQSVLCYESTDYKVEDMITVDGKTYGLKSIKNYTYENFFVKE